MTAPTGAARTRTARAVAALVVVLAGLVGVSGCAIQPNAEPRDIPEDQRPQLDPAAAAAGAAAGSGRVFLVTGTGDSARLRSVPREDTTPETLIGALLEGPNQTEVDAGLATALPSGLSLNATAESGGTFTIDVSDAILELSSADLRLAVAQLVFTASEFDGVRDVEVLVDGAARELPNGDGELRATPLDVYDFVGLAETSQPDYPPIPSPLPDAGGIGDQTGDPVAGS